jgi:hypothetical protein
VPLKTGKVFLVLAHNRRRILHFNVIRHPGVAVSEDGRRAISGSFDKTLMGSVQGENWGENQGYGVARGSRAVFQSCN